jgi:hypothetical protein
MKRRTGMNITLLLIIMIISALLIASASASLESAGKFYLQPLPGLVDRFQHDENKIMVSAPSNCNESKTLPIASNKMRDMMLGPPSIEEGKSVGVEGMILNSTGYVPMGVPTPIGAPEALEAQNVYRAAVGEPPLVWSATLAGSAQTWAQHLADTKTFLHSCPGGGCGYGENLAAGMPANSWTNTQLVDLWGAEKQYFKCGTFPDVSTTGNWEAVGHYTQMIWPDTKQCGCGYATSSSNWGILVCQYQPPGNYIGTYICPANTPPNKPSKPSGSASGYAYASYSYSTSATDPEKNQVKYTFDWGDGTSSSTGLVNSGTSASKSHKWHDAGTYKVKANATDSRGATSEYSSSLTVTIAANNPPNTPSMPSGPASGKPGTSYSYSTSAIDPDGNQVNYTFDWGDGTNSVTSMVNSGSVAAKSHTWSKAGTYPVKAKAKDSRGASSGWSSLNVTINAVPSKPSKPSGSSSGYAWVSYSYSTSATDSDGDKVKYTFDWGDGTNSSTGLVNSGTSASKSHKWHNAGTYKVKANATDSRGATSGYSSSLTVTIAANNPPNMPSMPSGPASGKKGTSYSYSTSAADPDKNQVKYTFDWGDGTNSVTSLVNSGTKASAFHKWSTAGTYLVKAKATDSKGAGSMSWSASINVKIT